MILGKKEKGVQIGLLYFLPYMKLSCALMGIGMQTMSSLASSQIKWTCVYGLYFRILLHRKTTSRKQVKC